MATQSHEITKTLNRLIEVCKDSEKGFREAAQDVRDEHFKETFLDYSYHMRHFGAVLQDHVLKMGNTPREKGTILAALHRAHIHLRAILNWHDARLVLLECERGEKRALDTYQQVLEHASMPGITPIIEKQFVELIEMSNYMRELETGEKAVPDDSLLRLH